MTKIIPAIIAAVLVSGSAYAQSINIGPGGVSVDPRSPQERAYDREAQRERYERQREREWRRANYRDERCRTITTQRETPRGVVSRTERVCD